VSTEAPEPDDAPLPGEEEDDDNGADPNGLPEQDVEGQ
jgi:hypothetical protein